MPASDRARTTVIVPARNAARTIGQTLDSLLAQTDRDWQALIVDDGSTDETPTLIATYAQRDHRFIGLPGRRAGVAAARNVGLASAHGQRLLFLDSDDWIDAKFLELMNAALDAAPGAVAACCDFRRVMAGGGLAPMRSTRHVAQSPFDAFSRSCATAIHSVLIDRGLVERCGGFDTALQTCEDWDLWQRAARLGGTWVHVARALSFYRASAHSLTQDVEHMLADARTVIDRGFAPQPALANMPGAHAAGASRADGASADLAHAYFALWCAAFDCGRGGGGAEAFDCFGALSADPTAAGVIADVLHDGMMVGLRATPDRLAARWTDCGVAVTALVSHLGAAWRDPVAARRIQYRFEHRILEHDNLAEPRVLSLTLGQRIDLRHPTTLTPPAAVDRLHVRLTYGRRVVAQLHVGVLGAVTPQDWFGLALERSTHDSTAARAGSLSRGSRSPRALLRALHSRCVRTWCRIGRAVLRRRAGPHASAHSHRAQLRRLQLEAAEAALRLCGTSEAMAPVAARRGAQDSDDQGGRKAYWERIFERADPWGYGRAYEREKYDRQLSQLEGVPIARALELACAEGHFTAQLAPRVGHLIASDISITALARARERCSAQHNVEFMQLDLIGDDLPQDLDLIICSEVLYYVENEALLEHVAKRLAAALRPGGRLLSAHAWVLTDDPTVTGFDWGHPWGGRKISSVFAAVPELALERALHSELYGIDVFLRRDAQQAAPVAVVEQVPVTAAIEHDVARFIVWGGAVTTRAAVAATERREQMPVLMYHRVARDGQAVLARYRVSPEMFERQMTWLRRRGYHSITPGELLWHIQQRQPFAGRPVMITFDDGCQDFADAAWPVLRRHDFGAEVFVVTDRVGETADWDAHHGAAAALMDAPTLVQLAREGVGLASHLASHRAADGLSTLELAGELARSRAMLQRWQQRTADALAAPFGVIDERLRQLAADLGYRIIFGTRDGLVGLASDPHDLPRIEVRGDWTLDAFAARLGACR